MKIFGLFQIKNEIDIIEITLRHHLENLIDEAIVVDKGSMDGTLELVCELASDLPIHVASEPGTSRGGQLATSMARYAARAGADWVLPVDADEFWVTSGPPLRAILTKLPAEVVVLHCQIVNFVQRRDVVKPTPSSLSAVTMRVADPKGQAGDAQELVESRQIAFIEMDYPTKCISRTSSTIEFVEGHHWVEGVGGEERTTNELVCLHVPLRARSLLSLKADHGRQKDEAGDPTPEGWHLRRWWRLAREGRISEEWAANSQKDGTLLVGTRIQPLVRDDRFQAVVAPWIAAGAGRFGGPVHDLKPSVGVYLLALKTVPGRFSELDFRMFVEIDRLQREAGIHGHLLELGVHSGKSAILLGLLAAADEQLVVYEPFNDGNGLGRGRVDDEGRHKGFGQGDFERQYLRFHSSIPWIVVGPLIDTDPALPAGTCRVVHIGGLSQHSMVRDALIAARQLLGADGLVIVDGISDPHSPGAALAAWEMVASGFLEPVCLTESKLYATVKAETAQWAKQIEGWAQRQQDMDIEIHELARWRVPRLTPRPPDERLAMVEKNALIELEPADVAPLTGPPLSQKKPECGGVVDSNSPILTLRLLLGELRPATMRAVEARRHRVTRWWSQFLK